MFDNARRCGLLACAVAGAMAGVVGFAGTTASAEPTYPQPPAPAPLAGAQQIGMYPAAPVAVPAAAPVAAAAITPADVDTFVSPCNFPGVIFIALSPQSHMYAVPRVRVDTEPLTATLRRCGSKQLNWTILARHGYMR